MEFSMTAEDATPTSGRSAPENQWKPFQLVALAMAAVNRNDWLVTYYVIREPSRVCSNRSSSRRNLKPAGGSFSISLSLAAMPIASATK
jgi:hypothetical protein